MIKKKKHIYEAKGQKQPFCNAHQISASLDLFLSLDCNEVWEIASSWVAVAHLERIFQNLLFQEAWGQKDFFPSNDNAYLYSNSWNTPHSKERVQRLETNTHLVVVPGLSAHPAHAHAGVGADLDAGRLGRTHRLLHGLHQVLCITHQHVCRLLILLGA